MGECYYISDAQVCQCGCCNIDDEQLCQWMNVVMLMVTEISSYSNNFTTCESV